MKTYVGTDGKLHFVNSAGADTALNFNSGAISKIVVVCTCYCTWSYDTRTCSTQTYTITSIKQSNGTWKNTTSTSGAGLFQVGASAAGCMVYQNFTLVSVTVS